MKQLIVLLLVLGAVLPACSQGSWEVDVVRSINPANPKASFVWSGLSATAKPIAAAVPAGMLVAALLEKNRELRNNAFEMAGALAFTTVATAAIKQVVQRPRPYQRYAGIYPDRYDDARSFPSGHAAVAFSTATSLALQYRKWYITVPAFLWAGAAGYSRMYMGQHYPTDIIGAAITGAGSAWVAHLIGNKLFRRKR